MDNEAKWFVGGIVTVILSFVLAATYTNIKDNAAMLEMIKAGATALEARCAVKNKEKDTECAVLFSKKGN